MTIENLGKNLTEYLNSRGQDDTYQRLLRNALADEDVKEFLKEHEGEINNDSVRQSAASIYEFYNHKKNPSELSKDYAPKLIVSNHNIEVAYYPNRSSQERKQRRIHSNGFIAMGMPRDIKDADIRNYSGKGRQDAYGQALSFIDEFQRNNNKFVPGLYLSGDMGVGKTYLLAAIANELNKHDIHSILLHFPTLAVDMKNSIGNNQTLNKIDRLKKSEILMLDDMGADAMSAWIRDEVLGVILQYRMQEYLPTFFSSNFSMKELEKHLSISQRGEIETVKAKRIMERIKFLSREVVITGPDRRFEN